MGEETTRRGRLPAVDARARLLWYVAVARGVAVAVRQFFESSDLTESPRDRLRSVTLGLFADKSGPNVVAGIFIGGVLQAAVGFSPWWWPIITGMVWVVWVLIYAVADELKQAIEAEQNRTLEPESEFYGIE